MMEKKMEKNYFRFSRIGGYHSGGPDNQDHGLVSVWGPPIFGKLPNMMAMLRTDRAFFQVLGGRELEFPAVGWGNLPHATRIEEWWTHTLTHDPVTVPHVGSSEPRPDEQVASKPVFALGNKALKLEPIRKGIQYIPFFPTLNPKPGVCIYIYIYIYMFPDSLLNTGSPLQNLVQESSAANVIAALSP